MIRKVVLISMALCAALSGCGDDPEKARKRDTDPVMDAALQGQLMVDPDLSQQNMRNQATVPGGPIDPATPAPDSATGSN